jgi:hypothetical protein
MSLETLKQDLFKYVALRLGDGIIDLELDPEHYEVAYQEALGVFRQRAQASTEESYVFVELQEGQDVYTLPQEVTHVRQIFRRTLGDSAGPYSTSFDPFSQATLNVYLLNYTYSGGLATFEMYSQYVELAMRMFGGFMNYTFNPVTKELRIVRDPKSTGEDVLLWTFNSKPEVSLLSDYQTGQWIKDYTAAAAKMIIGQARSKYQSIAGPGGGTVLNGNALVQEAAQEKAQLIQDLATYTDGSQPLTWVIG